MFEEITPGLWHATHDHTLGGVQFRTRATLVRLEDGGLWMHSPIPLDDALEFIANEPVFWIYT